MPANAVSLIQCTGSKRRLAPWVISHFPPHEAYVDLYGGTGAILFRKPPVKWECYNDLNRRLVNVFRVIRRPAQRRRLIRLLDEAPIAREEFHACVPPADDPVEDAYRVIYLSTFSFGSRWQRGTASFNSGGRLISTKRGNHIPRRFRRKPNIVNLFAERFRLVEIENKPALKLIAYHGQEPLALLYADPPYLPATRQQANDYEHEMHEADHIAMLAALKACKAQVVISGPDCDLYRDELAGWGIRQKSTHSATAKGAKRRQDCVWLAPWNGEATEAAIRHRAKPAAPAAAAQKDEKTSREEAKGAILGDTAIFKRGVSHVRSQRARARDSRQGSGCGHNRVRAVCSGRIFSALGFARLSHPAVTYPVCDREVATA